MKARLCARGYEEVESFKTESQTCSRESVRLAITLIASNKWNLNAINIKTAFLQGKKIDWTVIIKPPKEAQTNKLWKLNKCVYGLADASRCWYLRLKEELLKLNVTVSKYDPGLFYYTKDNKLQGLVVCFIDDILWRGTAGFKADVIDRLGQTFNIGSKFSQTFTYLGIEFHQNNHKSITIDQNNHAKAVQFILLTTNQLTEKDLKIPQEDISAVRSLVGQLNWLSGISRPEISFDTCNISTKVNNMKIRDVIELNKVVKRVKNEKNQIFFSTLDPNTIKLVLYTDASINNLLHGGSQGGHIIFLTDFLNKCCPLIWNSSKIKRVLRSTLAAETLALNEGCETALYLSQILAEILHLEHIPSTCLTDNKPLYDVTNSLTSTTDRLLRVEIATIRQLCERKQVTLKWVVGKHQPSDCLTKKGASQLRL